MRTLFKTTYGQDLGLFRDRRQAVWYGLLLALMLVLPLLLGPYFLGEVINMLIWSLAGLGLMILVGQTGQVSLGHAAFLAIGCYTNIILQLRLGLPFPVAFPLAGVVAGLAGIALAVPTTRLHGIYLAIATLAVSVLVEDLIVIAAPITGGIAGLAAPDISLFGLPVNRYANADRFYWLTLAVVLVVVVAYNNLLRSPLGRAFAAVRDSEISAEAMGINVARAKAISFGLSSAITGLAGALMGHFIGYVNHEAFLLLVSIQLLLMIVVGGLGFIHGAFLGAAVVVFLPQALAIARDWIGSATGIGSIVIPGLEAAVFGAILILVILFEPTGLYGRWLKIRTYFELFPFYRRDMFRRQKRYLKTERMR
jgi:branched-chain amino acid transport system permease protein